MIRIKTDKLFTNITDQVQDAVPSGFTGLISIYCPHSTAGLIQLEDELLHLVDVRFFLDQTVPKYKEPEGNQKNIKYLHDLISLRVDVPADERINGHSHVRSLFFNSSEFFHCIDGKIVLGRWKKLFFVELDSNRERRLSICFVEGSVHK